MATTEVPEDEAVKALEEALIRRSGERSLSEAQPLQVFDVAGGPGRYLLSVVKKLSSRLPIQAVVRDWSEDGLEKGRRLAEQMQVSNVRYHRGDAFSPQSLAEIPRESDVGIVSGLFELFPENAPVLNSLRGLRDAMAVGGLLIYTNQPWHPQLEMIAEVLPNREGKPWVMRRRTQMEMDQLVAEAGFMKERTRVDDEGIFTVSVARRV